jgi:hypothetical protein
MTERLTSTFDSQAIACKSFTVVYKAGPALLSCGTRIESTRGANLALADALAEILLFSKMRTIEIASFLNCQLMPIKAPQKPDWNLLCSFMLEKMGQQDLGYVEFFYLDSSSVCSILFCYNRYHVGFLQF